MPSERLQNYFKKLDQRENQPSNNMIEFAESLTWNGQPLRLWDYQKEALKSQHPKRIRRWGRRTGKSLLEMVEVAYYLKYPEELSENGSTRILFFFPNLAMIEVWFDYFLELIDSDKELKSSIVRAVRGNPSFILSEKNGVRSSVKLIHHNIRSMGILKPYAHLVIADELAFIDQEVIDSLIIPCIHEPDTKFLGVGSSRVVDPEKGYDCLDVVSQPGYKSFEVSVVSTERRPDWPIIESMVKEEMSKKMYAKEILAE